MKKLKKIIVLFFVMTIAFALAGPGFAGDVAKKAETPSVEDAAKININTASVAELTQLKGIGTKYAEKIVEFREKEPFKNPQEITKVPGIGMKTYELNKDSIIVE
ncbi:MAG: helix-hairpin-helix domain-containing protein [Pseudomonadota bacterium]|jgi:competence protein ComEA